MSEGLSVCSPVNIAFVCDFDDSAMVMTDNTYSFYLNYKMDLPFILTVRRNEKSDDVEG